MERDPQVGVITEVGDLGLGFNPLSEEDQKIIKESNRSEEETEKE